VSEPGLCVNAIDVTFQEREPRSPQRVFRARVIVDGDIAYVKDVGERDVADVARALRAFGFGTLVFLPPAQPFQLAIPPVAEA
jgi:hypothetical protein